ncbi:MAG: hypothetical protein MIO93_03145 [ANME-2 cluster archaeon]|nr:hypothetical protein [ANME-2 cluster archaeon]
MINNFLVCLTVMVQVLSSGGRVVLINDTHIPVDFNYIYRQEHYFRNNRAVHPAGHISGRRHIS